MNVETVLEKSPFLQGLVVALPAVVACVVGAVAVWGGTPAVKLPLF